MLYINDCLQCGTPTGFVDPDPIVPLCPLCQGYVVCPECYDEYILPSQARCEACSINAIRWRNSDGETGVYVLQGDIQDTEMIARLVREERAGYCIWWYTTVTMEDRNA